MCDTRRSSLGTVHTLAAWMHTAPAWVHASPAWIAWIRYMQLSLNTHGDRHGPRGRSRRSWTPRPPPPTTSRALSCRAASRSASRLVISGWWQPTPVAVCLGGSATLRRRTRARNICAAATRALGLSAHSPPPLRCLAFQHSAVGFPYF